jgi:adenine phosphoribosyltransferase
MMAKLESLIRDVPDFPIRGIVFKDIAPLLGDIAALKDAADRLAEPFRGAGVEMVAGVESRGFLFGVLVAERLGAGFVPVRKPGKLPWKTIRQDYKLEYGAAAVEIHTDAIRPGAKVLVVDDLLATGGTVAAACDLVRRLKGEIVGVAFVVELAFLKGRDKLPGLDVRSLIKYD